ncbi:nucleoside deaminase [Shewanella abyssi]|uniref:nucleoside deaminase n=1 Tax=Shewanella abyssi TaxID=311789 RepID=UPI00200D4881|nr:nucleoside deaminase [Shewanella abyssi]MCL1049162.1 nucleoside deaminase [Shewanella abyssi]
MPTNIEQLMQEVVTYSTEHVHQGGIPFTSFVVDDKGHILGRGVNRVMENNDPTAHAEVEAIRDACRNVNSSNLRGMTLLASGEPCGMCYLNALYAGITEVVFAADSNEAAESGFDYRATYKMLAGFPQQWPMHMSKFATAGALEPFKLFQRKRNF